MSGPKATALPAYIAPIMIAISAHMTFSIFILQCASISSPAAQNIAPKEKNYPN